MQLCFPVVTDNGLESPVYGHFGSAPLFLLVDTESSMVTPLTNRDQQHTHGACNPLQALAGAKVDAIVVGGIGGGALAHLQRAGLRVYRAAAPLVSDNVKLFREERLSELTLNDTCGAHKHGHGHQGQSGCCH
jgi:predicted Fe-Mo cluster-binding NifX family protein